MSDVDLLGMYSRAAQEAFRLEAQQRYAVPAEDAQFRAFAEGRPLPSDPRVDRSMQIIRDGGRQRLPHPARPRRGPSPHGCTCVTRWPPTGRTSTPAKRSTSPSGPGIRTWPS